MIAEDRLFIDGAWAAAQDGRWGEVVSPVTGAVFGRVAYAGAADVDLAARAAARAFPGWAATSPELRAAALRAIADHLDARAPALARVTALNNGKPLAQGLSDVADATACYRYYADLILKAPPPRAVAGLPADWRATKDRIPLGPVALITPWNFPLTTAAWKVAPALAVGCTVVLKVSEVAPFAELALGAAALAAGLPPGVLNILTGGADCGAALTRHPAITAISFTGSNAVGRLVMAAAAERSVPVTLELGGKSPVIVLPDVDPEWAAGIVAEGIFTNSGQICSAGSRLIAHIDIAEALLDRLVALADGMAMGDPLDPATAIGPVTSAAQRDKIAAYLAIAQEEGLRRATARSPAEGPGFFVPPTIYRDVPPTSRLWREEIFGPVLVTATFVDEDDAVTLANDTAFGLGATVLCADTDRAALIAAGLRAGNVWVNSGQMVFPEGSWGGFGASGFGRELGPEALCEFTGLRQTVTAGAPPPGRKAAR